MKSKHVAPISFPLCAILLLVDLAFAEPNVSSLPSDLVDTQYSSLEGLAPGSQEAQDRQRQAVQELGLPLEVKTRQTGIVLRLIPPGTFTMGSPESEAGRWDGEGPQHQVTLTQAFYCGKFEVTQGQWESVMGSNPSYFQNAGPDAPVETVDWEDCQAFLTALCHKENVPDGTYRLLTEAEWEYACRAGTTGPYCFGDDASVLGEYAWFWDNSDLRTHPVGQKKPNAFGLHDMHGNVWELCQDWYGSSYYGVSPATDPLGPASGGGRVGRGGSWYGSARHCRSAHRAHFPAPVSRYIISVGLRLVRTTPSYP